MPVQPYLFFDGRCEEAVEFYRKALGGEVEMLMRYKDSPEPPPGARAGYDDKIIHASLRIGDGSVMMSDDCMGHPSFQGFSLSLAAADEKEASTQVQCAGRWRQGADAAGQDLFSPCFGMVADRFSVSWMVIVPAPEA